MSEFSFYYLDNYPLEEHFKNVFQKKYDRENAKMPDVNERISFAHNARTICIAFVAFASRYYQGNINVDDLTPIFNAAKVESATNNGLYEIFSNMDDVQFFLPKEIFGQKDKYDAVLEQLFTTIINAGITSFTVALRYDPTLTATNFLKREKNYYGILSDHWPTINSEINRILAPVMPASKSKKTRKYTKSTKACEIAND